MKTLEPLLAEHPFLKGMPKKYLKILTGCASNIRFEPGEFIFRQGEDAEHFYLIREGQVALETFSSDRGPINVETIEGGSVLGWSWLVFPYHWHFDAHVKQPTRAIALNGQCIRKKFEKDNGLGYEMMKRFLPVITERLQATRIQMQDIYSKGRM